MIAYDELWERLAGTPLESWLEKINPRLDVKFDADNHGDLPRWRSLLENLPRLDGTTANLNDSVISISGECNFEQRSKIESDLRQFHPWRKGPYNIFGIQIDTEWRSDLKWDRLKDQIAALKNRTILDVGCGNGYYCWRMLAAGARLVIGIDPTMLSVLQFHAVKHFVGDTPVFVLPIGIEELPTPQRAFDSVFSMGVLYHRRSPLDHLFELHSHLRPGGELILETIVIDGSPGQTLVPEGRYAKMRNVWFLPSCTTLVSWLKRCGFKDIRVIDVCKTTPSEQRTTDWMRFQSLSDFLDTDNPNCTVEGLPAPTRAVVLARAR